MRVRQALPVCALLVVTAFTRFHSTASTAQSVAVTSPVTQPGDAARGRDLFNRRCTGCHSLTQNSEGPRLGGVYGRIAATAPGFSYSAALTAAQLTWEEHTLDRWLTDPNAFVPGNNMDFRVPRPQERADIIAFLKASSGK
jgi:cytochrome c